MSTKDGDKARDSEIAKFVDPLRSAAEAIAPASGEIQAGERSAWGGT